MVLKQNLRNKIREIDLNSITSRDSMFSTFNPESPFYLNNNFDFSSDSDSDEDFEMSALNQIHNSGSTIHKDLIEFFKEHPISQETYDGNLQVLKSLYDVKVELWNEYKDAVKKYSNDDNEDERLAKAIAIGDAAVKIRDQNDVTKLTVIRQSTKEVTVNGLTADEIILLKELHELVLVKMQGTGQRGSAENANKMVAEFKRDMELAKIDNTFPSRWIKNHGVWKCCEHEKRQGRDLVYNYNDAGVLDPVSWKLVVDEFNKHKVDAIPQQGGNLANASNKFAVDVYCATINRYKTTMSEQKQSWENFVVLMKIVAAFQCKSSIKKTEWLMFVRSNEQFKPFFNGLDEINFLYDNPGKLTRPRLFACAASVFPAPEPLSLFGVNDRLALIPKTIAKIYSVEKKFNIIDKMRGTTSSSEHLCHLMLTLGAQNSYVWNRNKIPHSIREVKFNLN